MLLEGKNAVVYGSGSIGGAVATAFGREGARVFLAGRNLATLEAVAARVRATGAVAVQASGVDVSFNLISHGGAPESIPEGVEGGEARSRRTSWPRRCWAARPRSPPRTGPAA